MFYHEGCRAGKGSLAALRAIIPLRVLRVLRGSTLSSRCYYGADGDNAESSASRDASSATEVAAAVKMPATGAGWGKLFRCPEMLIYTICFQGCSLNWHRHAIVPEFTPLPPRCFMFCPGLASPDQEASWNWPVGEVRWIHWPILLLTEGERPVPLAEHAKSAERNRGESAGIDERTGAGELRKTRTARKGKRRVPTPPPAPLPVPHSFRAFGVFRSYPPPRSLRALRVNRIHPPGSRGEGEIEGRR